MPAQIALTAMPMAGAASAQGTAPAGGPAGVFTPHLETEVTANLFGTSAYRAPDRTQRFRNLYTKTEIASTLHLAEIFSLQAAVKFEPLAGGPTNGQDRAFQDQGAFLSTAIADWQAQEWLSLRVGRFTAPFGRGYTTLPGIRLTDNASVYEIADSLGGMATLGLLDDAEGWGEHSLSLAAFTLDTTAMSSTLITRKRFGRDDATRFSRTTRAMGGPGNTGTLDNAALALNGENIAALPGFSYHLALLSRGEGVDGTAREWGYAAGASWRVEWSEGLATTLHGEAVRLRNAGGRPTEDVAGTPAAIAATRTVTTLAAQTAWGPWRATLGWQTETRDRSANTIPRASYIEASVGRELALGFTADLGWSRTRAGDASGGRSDVDAGLFLLGWRGSF